MTLPLTEKAFQAQVVQYARLMGWKVFHPWISIKSASGFPDLVLVRPPLLVFAELKRDGKSPTPAQLEWLDALRASGTEAYVWHPSDWAAIERILERDRRDYPPTSPAAPSACTSREEAAASSPPSASRRRSGRS